MPRLTVPQAKKRLLRIPRWALQGRTLRRQFTFAGFPAAVAFVNQVARIAEARDHHPDIDIRWNKVTLTLSTHSEGGLTGKDFASARDYSALFDRDFESGPKMGA